jgi:ribosomal protein S19
MSFGREEFMAPFHGRLFYAIPITDMTIGYQLADVKMTITPSNQQSLPAVLI